MLITCDARGRCRTGSEVERSLTARQSLPRAERAHPALELRLEIRGDVIDVDALAAEVGLELSAVGRGGVRERERKPVKDER